MQHFIEGWKNMGFKKFSLLIVIRTVLAMACIVLVTIAITAEGYHTATLLLMIVLIAQFTELVRFVSKTNAELVRFFDAARYADFSQRFDLSQVGSGFEELGNAFTEILHRLQKARTNQEQHIRHLKAIVEHVPVPLMSLANNDELTLWNNSARRLFGANPIVRLSDLAGFGQHFPEKLSNMSTGERQLIQIEIDGLQHQLSVSATEVIVAQKQEILFSLQDIKSELITAQLQAWQDLVRVLTHEIMNSITPVASLAKTAVVLVEDVQQQVIDMPTIKEELSDVTDAVQTVARRSDGLMKFVSSYRQLTRLPEPHKKAILVADLFEQVTQLAAIGWSDKNIDIKTNVTPQSLDINVDHHMLEQVLINIIKNAEHALTEAQNAEISLNAYINARGHPIIEISDNGHGMSKDVANNVFVPFFTTKRDGSGVGLALTRQIMLAHGGHVTLHTEPNHGSTFKLIF
ncbi:sensor histidine kinase [Thalassotalea atypica]|uniref:sensor histidine kinase n=1 Tax=Thalassotalea atypica TaxID=2054316 RepID=UPI0025734A4E|nr:ATP-binding protein [Thalassotalea atypica]